MENLQKIYFIQGIPQHEYYETIFVLNEQF